MLNRLLIAVSVVLVSFAARADVLSERVVLKVTSTLCPNSGAYEVVAVNQSAFGAPVTNAPAAYVVPTGYALEVTDLDININWLETTYQFDVTLGAQNRLSGATSWLYTYVVRPQPIRAAALGIFSTASPTSWTVPTGTIHESFESGMLVANGARLCVGWPASIANQFSGYPYSPVVLRGRLHKLDAVNVVQPPLLIYAP